MAVEQFKFCIAGMIEGCVIPVLRCVATRTVIAAATVVGIVFRMAANTGRWRSWECPIFVTIKARRILMFADEQIVSCRVVEFGVQPLGRLVTTRTVGTHGFFVRKVFFVAIHAVSRRFTMLFVGLMAGATFGLQMRTGQVEVCE